MLICGHPENKKRRKTIATFTASVKTWFRRSYSMNI